MDAAPCDLPPGVLFGTNPAAAIAAIRDRAARWRAGRHDRDGRRLGLVIEGGAMRAVCSAGGALALAHLGFFDLFDEAYATSAGVMNAAYFLSGQGELGITIYYEDLVAGRFMNRLRWWKVLDVDHLFDRTVLQDKPLDVDAVLSSRTRFSVAVIDKQTGQGRVVRTQQTRAPLLQVLKAATAMPVLYNRTVDVDGRRCMDGGLAIPFPIEQALTDGCTDVLVLLTRPASFVCPQPSRTGQRLFRLICAAGNEELCRTYASSHDRSNAARDLAIGRSPAPAGINIATICPEEPETVHRTTSNPTVLRTAATRYGRIVLRLFGTSSADADAWSPPASSRDAKPGHGLRGAGDGSGCC